MNRGNLLLTFAAVDSVFSSPEWWSADITDVLSPLTVTLVVSVPLGVLFIYTVAKCTGYLDITDIFVGAVVCIQDSFSDWLLIGEWYLTSNYWWATLMLMSIVLGGTVTAVTLRVETPKDLKCSSFDYHQWKKRDLLELAVDISGFAVVRLIKTEYNERVVVQRTSRRCKKSKYQFQPE